MRSAIPARDVADDALRRGVVQRRAALRADASNDARAPRRAAAPTTTGTPGLMMPAFSNAIASQRVAEVLLVIERDRRDRRRPPASTTLVASSRPPSPTSMTATSTPARAEQLERDGGRRPRRTSGAPRACLRRRSVVDGVADRRRARSSSAPRSTGRPSITNRSSRSHEVRRGVAARAVAGGAQRRVDHRVTEPLPLVPAMCTERNCRSGWPSAAQSVADVLESRA